MNSLGVNENPRDTSFNAKITEIKNLVREVTTPWSFGRLVLRFAVIVTLQKSLDKK